MSWRFHLQEVPSGIWLDRDLPLIGAKVTTSISGPASISGMVGLSYDQRTRLKEWGTLLIAEEDDREPIVCIIDSLELDGDDLKVDAGGFSMYPKDQPWTAPEFSGTSVDPLDIVRKIWDHVQAQPSGNLKVVVDNDGSPVRLGVAESLDRSKAKAGVAEATSRAKTTNDANLAAVKAQGVTKVALLAAGGRPSNGLVLHQDSAPSGDKRSTLNLWIDKNNSNKASRWDGKKWVPQTTSTQAVINDRLATWLSSNVAVTTTKTSAAAAKKALSAAKSKLSDVKGGEAEPYTLNWWDTHDLGGIIDTLAKETPFEFRERASWAGPKGDDLALRLEIGVPVLGLRRPDISFEIGVNATAVPPINERDYASEITTLGAGEGRAMVRAVTSGNPGRLRRARVISRKDIKKVDAAAAASRAELQVSTAAWVFESLTVIDHEMAPYGSYRVGDQVFVSGDAGWIQLANWVRITEITSDCTTGAVELRVEVT